MIKFNAQTNRNIKARFGAGTIIHRLYQAITK